MNPKHSCAPAGGLEAGEENGGPQEPGQSRSLVPAGPRRGGGLTLRNHTLRSRIRKDGAALNQLTVHTVMAHLAGCTDAK